MHVAIERRISAADLHAHLGRIPLDRIRIDPPMGTATEEDLLKVGKPICELIDGILVEKAMGDRESLLACYLSSRIWSYVSADDLGVVLGADGLLRLDAGQIRAPDVSFIPWSAFPNEELPEEAFWSIAPALAIEVLSPSNTRAEIDRKLTELFAAGMILAWVINPRTKRAKVYTSAKKFKEFDESATLDGGKVLPGFKLSLTDLFASTKPRKKKP